MIFFILLVTSTLPIFAASQHITHYEVTLAQQIFIDPLPLCPSSKAYIVELPREIYRSFPIRGIIQRSEAIQALQQDEKSCSYQNYFLLSKTSHIKNETVLREKIREFSDLVWKAYPASTIYQLGTLQTTINRRYVTFATILRTTKPSANVNLLTATQDI